MVILTTEKGLKMGVSCCNHMKKRKFESGYTKLWDKSLRKTDIPPFHFTSSQVSSLVPESLSPLHEVTSTQQYQLSLYFTTLINGSTCPGFTQEFPGFNTESPSSQASLYANCSKQNKGFPKTLYPIPKTVIGKKYLYRSN